jgi:hypothetical protein
MGLATQAVNAKASAAVTAASNDRPLLIAAGLVRLHLHSTAKDRSANIPSLDERVAIKKATIVHVVRVCGIARAPNSALALQPAPKTSDTALGGLWSSKEQHKTQAVLRGY